MNDGERNGNGRARRDQQVEGYWKSLEVKRDPDAEARRQANIKAASERRQATEQAARERGLGRPHEQAWRQLRGRATDAIAVAILLIAGLAAALVIIANQGSALPSWVPFLGQDFVHYKVELPSAQAVTPGQGQAVDIAGIQIGKITSVSLVDGHAEVGIDVEPKYQQLIHPDATALLRPKTNLNDMIIAIDPGKGHGELQDGSTISLANARSNINPDQVLATLDGDTRTYLQMLLQAGAEGIGSRKQGLQLSAGLRRLAPFSRYIAELNGAVAKRRQALANAIHYFSLVTGELAKHDSELARFVESSNAALGNFAAQSGAIQQSLREFPTTLTVARRGLASSGRLSRELRPTLTALIPQAQALGPAFDATERLFRETRPTLKNELRPFSRQVRPVLVHTKQAAAPFKTTVTKFGDFLRPLNFGFNELAHKPKSANSYLFYLPWVNHDFNASFLSAPGSGPLMRGLLLMSCHTATLANGFAGGRPFLKTVIQAVNLPPPASICNR
jgi:phospholipid/cholesterol/gamma-HCH transport system substrate-binding protein